MARTGNPLTRFLRVLLGIYRGFRALVLNLLFLVLLLVLLSPLLPEPRPPVERNSALVLNPAGVLVEQLSIVNPVNELLNDAAGVDDAGEVLLRDVLDAIAIAAEDDRISALVLALDDFQGGGFAQLQDVAAAIRTFRESGKKVYAAGNSFTQAQYYLASQADEVIMNPLGAVDLQGFGAWQMYYDQALDKLGVNMHIFRVGEYKAAVEPYERSDMSPEATENYDQLLGELWAQYLADVSITREIEAATVNDYINRLDYHLAEHDGDPARLARAMGLVDRVETRPEMIGYLQKEVDSMGSTFRQIDFLSYLDSAREPETIALNQNEIGLIVASGVIQDGEAVPGNIGAENLSNLIRIARENTRLKALVLRVDSPGGSRFASELIREQLEAFKATGRPLVISMGSVAASGGYWISTAGDEIWASPTTITGSIGIYGVVPTFEETFSKLGINVDGTGTTALSGAAAIGRPMPEVLARSLQQVVSNGYEQFLSIVAEARELSIEEVDRIGQGRIWSGQAAQELNLVDNLGDLDDALAAAANLAGVEEWKVTMLQEPLTPLQLFLRQLAGSDRVKALLPKVSMPSSPASELMREIQEQANGLMPYGDPGNAYVHCFQCSLLDLL